MARDSARQAKEIELKLEFDPADAARLASHPALRAGPAPQEEHQLISTYFDTPDCALRKAGVYLRVRENDGHIVQTIKTAKSETDLIERLEWEREITSRNPDLDGVDDTPLKPLLTAGVRAALRPMFETQIRRHVFRILRDGSEIEVAIDQGEIATKTGMQAISELELELKRGKTKELFRLARVLGRTVPLRLEVKSKAERGYALLKGGSLQVEKAAEIDIPPNMSAEEAFRAIARSCVRQLVANEPILFAGRAEGLHQMRIGLRRLRASIAIFADVVGDETREDDQDRAQMDHAGAWSGARPRCVRRRGARSAAGRAPQRRGAHPDAAQFRGETQGSLSPRRQRRPLRPLPRRRARPCRLGRDGRLGLGRRRAPQGERGRGLSPSMPRRNCRSFASASSARAPTFAI